MTKVNLNKSFDIQIINMVILSKQKLKIVFVAKLGAMGDDKFHVMVPKQFNDQIRDLKGKQVKIIMNDEL